MATSTKFPTATATINTVSPYDDDDWVSIGNITADDTSYASITASSYDANDYSYLAKAQTFAFAIPSTAVINGLVVETLARYAAGSATWDMMQLLNASGTAEGDNNAADGGALASSDTVETFGGATDKWGVTLTPTMVNDADFGVQFAIKANSPNTDVYVEYLKMTVYYTDAPAVTSVTPSETAEMTSKEVVIAGTDFTSATAVTVGGTNATTYNVDSAIQITATLPAKAAADNLQVQVTTAVGSSANVAGDNFTYYQDEISIERKDGAGGSYVEVHSGPWSDGEWPDEDTFADGTTYYYKATRTVKAVTSDYSAEDSVTFSSGGSATFLPNIMRHHIIGLGGPVHG